MAKTITVTLDDVQEKEFDEAMALIHLQGILMGEPVEKITVEDIVKVALILLADVLKTRTVKA